MSRGRGHEYDRNYVITHNWLGCWEASCDRCGAESKDAKGQGPNGGSLAAAFAFLWRHRKCEGGES